MPNANRVFIPKEELSLDVIKQYKVVHALPLHPARASQGFMPVSRLHAPPLFTTRIIRL